MALLPSLTNITDVAHVIQLAVAPVFLLTGIGAILSVLVNRLGRVVDRFRALDELVEGIENRAKNSITDEMERLSKRAKMIHWSIGLCTTSALFVCIGLRLCLLARLPVSKCQHSLLACSFWQCCVW